MVCKIYILLCNLNVRALLFVKINLIQNFWRSKMDKRMLMAVPTLFIFFFLTGCQVQMQSSASGAEQVTDLPQIPKNSQGRTVEQQNIWDRVKVTTDPTKVMWIHLIALDGNIIRRMPVRSKTTSSGKRLEPKQAADANGFYPNATQKFSRPSSLIKTDEIMQADGTYGDSDQYVYWFDPMGRYHQWGTAGGLGYLLTDYPIDLVNPSDKITGLYNMDKAAREWQNLQEQKLRDAVNTTKRHVVIPQPKPEVAQ